MVGDPVLVDLDGVDYRSGPLPESLILMRSGLGPDLPPSFVVPYPRITLERGWVVGLGDTAE